MPNSSPTAMIELLTRVLCDTLPDISDGAFLSCQTKDNQESVLRAAQHILDDKKTRKILFMSTSAMCGYPGFDSWKHALNKFGVRDEYIEGIRDDSTPSLNTLIETEAMVRHAKLNRFESIIIISSPFQQIRSFMTAVTVVLREYHSLRVYSYPGIPLPWSNSALHSQGSLKKTRISLIKSELDRIEKYNIKGDLDSVEDVLGYLNSRDSLSR